MEEQLFKGASFWEFYIYSLEDTSSVMPCVPYIFWYFHWQKFLSDSFHLIPESTVLFTKGTAYTVSFFFNCLQYLKQQIFLKLFLPKPFWLHVIFGHAEAARCASFIMLSCGRRCCGRRVTIRKLCSSSWLRALFKLMLEMWSPEKDLTFFLKIIFLLG